MIGPKEPGKPWLSRKGRRLNFAERGALNRPLAKLGEEFVVSLGSACSETRHSEGAVGGTREWPVTSEAFPEEVGDLVVRARNHCRAERAAVEYPQPKPILVWS